MSEAYKSCEEGCQLQQCGKKPPCQDYPKPPEGFFCKTCTGCSINTCGTWLPACETECKYRKK